MSPTKQPEPCADCGADHYPTKRRPDRCSRCQAKHTARACRRRDYHQRVKPNPVAMEAHREQCRIAVAAYRKTEKYRDWRRRYEQAQREKRQAMKAAGGAR